jgi:hypothetical protein
MERNRGCFLPMPVLRKPCPSREENLGKRKEYQTDALSFSGLFFGCTEVLNSGLLLAGRTHSYYLSCYWKNGVETYLGSRIWQEKKSSKMQGFNNSKVY